MEGFMKILGFVKTSTVDYPAKVVASIFLGGCNLDCEYCQNRDLINPAGIEPVISEEELIIYLKKRKGIIDGLCISGGEPTLHRAKLSEFMKKIKEELGNDFLIKLDTNGTNPEFLRENKSYIDYVAMDYKTFEYEKKLGVSKTKILESINVLKENYPDYEIRITLYPPYVKLIDIAFMVEELRGIKKLYLQNYREVEGASAEKYTEQNLIDIAKEFRDAKIECEIR
jgi:pyruvate formate lyase activating enzyme